MIEAFLFVLSNLMIVTLVGVVLVVVYDWVERWWHRD